MRSNSANNPTSPLPDWREMLVLARASPRCGARNRAGLSCQGPAMPNGRCRFHGGLSTGPRTSAGLARMKRTKTTTGLRTAEMLELRGEISALRRAAKAAREQS